MGMSSRAAAGWHTVAACVGLGPIGLEVARAASCDDRFAVTHAVDPAPALAGQSLATLLQADSREVGGPEILHSIEDLPQASGPSIAFLCTGSRLATISTQVQQLVDRKWNVISTCEELAYPVPANRAFWDRVDLAAQTAGVSVLGVGINPGFVMDLLPAVLALPCLNPRHVRILRRVDASRRRQPLQTKVGIGLTEIEFRRRAEANQIGHIGLQESARLMAASLGWELDTLSDDLEPIVDQTRHQVIGLREVLRGSERSGRGVELELEIYAGAMNEVDEITIEADPPVHCVISGGYQGDRATVGMVLNSAIAVILAAPGLRTVSDLPLVARRELPRQVDSRAAPGPR
jgi:2,4-diaminopentanoate dehydrogenase